MTKYFRVTAYCKEHDFSFIMDTNGLYEKLWELSAELIKNGMSIIEASSEEKFLDVNIEKVYDEPKQMILRATAKGKPETVTHTLNGITYKALRVGEKLYIPDRSEVV